MRDREEGRARRKGKLRLLVTGFCDVLKDNLGFNLSFRGCVKFGFFLGEASSWFGAFPGWEG